MKSDISQFKDKVASDIKRRWSLETLDPSSLPVLSCTLNPRLKLLKFLNDSDRQSVKMAFCQRWQVWRYHHLVNEPPTKKPATKSALDVLLSPEDDANDTAATLSDELQGFLAAKSFYRY